MSFVVILIISLSTLVRVELATHEHSFTQLRAERAAVLALQEALGNLQKMAGPDQRVTARADILDGGYSGLVPDPAKSHWTGVWRSDDTDPLNPDAKTFVGWLASMPDGNNMLGAATEVPGANAATLAGERVDGAGNTIPAVQAELVEVPDADIAYAWVILDEGIKAKVNTRGWEEDQAVYSQAGQLTQGLRFGPSEGAKAEALGGLGNFRQLITPDERARFTSLEDVDLFYSSGTGDRRFHDLTTWSYGVLANVKDGGLRRDLSRGMGDQFATLSGSNVLNTFPLKWDSLAAWYNLYQKLDNPDAILPVLDPKDTLPDLTASREEFDPANIETVALAEGGIEDWQLTSHPIAPVVQQVIWRIGGFTSDYNLNSQTWDWRSDQPPEGTPGRDNLESWGYMDKGRHVVSPLVVLWNPYNVALDTSDYRITYDPAAQIQVVTRDPDDPGNVHTMLASGSEDIVNLWQDSNSTTRTGHFTVELFSDYSRGSVTQPDQTILQPGEMRIFGLRFVSGTGSNADNIYGGGFGGWGSDRVPLQLIGPSAGSPHNTFRALVNSRNIEATDTDMDWVQDSLQLDFGSNTGSSDPNDFRLTLAMADANTGGEPETGFVVRDVWGLRPPASASGSYPFADIWTRPGATTSENLTLYDYWDIIRNSSLQTGSSGADILYAASIVARLKTSETELGADSVPLIAHFNPLAWHTRPGHPDEVHSPLWDVSVFNRSDWNLDKAQNSTLFEGTARWGNAMSSGGQERVVLKEIPRQPLFSIGQFMHADIGIFDTSPLYTVGGSYAPPFGPRSERIYDGGTAVDGTGTELEAIDLSWYYNDALFDEWFFSTVPNPGQNTRYPPFEDFDLAYIQAGKLLPNSHYRYFSEDGVFDGDYEDRLRDIDTAASALLVDGSFNINSTSVDAWKALLASLRQSEDFRYYNVADGSDIADTIAAGNMDVPLPRFLHPMASNLNADAGDSPQAWAGFRSLSATELNDLATEIVNQVRLRGPFRSLSDFVNRRLVDGPTGNAGALQVALDATVNDTDSFGGTPEQTSVWGEAVDWDEHAPASGAGAPGWVLQNDILQMLAPVLSARSDTFRIRAYGAARDPFTGEPVAESWCEAIVQRIPEWVDPTDAPEDDPASPVNTEFGRRFVLVSFRWLPQSDI
ncbi:MAG: hypothetical protein Q7Q73_05665 [Verrucomicrobiota bacterium JB024]|nr:hypothetical protein [Verrucomicrobiota bacterium JB024]